MSGIPPGIETTDAEPRPPRPAQRPLFSPAGHAALQALVSRKPLLAFDFDGTLAPIVDRPDDARLPLATARRLARLARRLPVAIVTGRSVEDVRGRLGFAPVHVVGSHGADGPGTEADRAALASGLDGLRRLLSAESGALVAAGVRIEDKGLSIALHYRLAADPLLAAARGRAVLESAGPGVRVFAGKMVLNATTAGSPDKAAAVRALLVDSGCSVAFFAGDDLNDEPVFRSAPADWLTVRVGGADAGSAAGWWIASPRDMPVLLDRLLAGSLEPGP